MQGLCAPHWLAKYTPNTLTSYTKLWQQAQTTLQSGYALDDEEAELGVSCIGVPVRASDGVMIARLSISASRDRRRNAWIRLIQRAGVDLSVRLGYVSGTDRRPI